MPGALVGVRVNTCIFAGASHHAALGLTRSNSGTIQATTKLVAMQQVETRAQDAARPRRGHAPSTRSSHGRPSFKARSVNTFAFSVSGGRVRGRQERHRGGWQVAQE